MNLWTAAHVCLGLLGCSVATDALKSGQRFGQTLPPLATLFFGHPDSTSKYARSSKRVSFSGGSKCGLENSVPCCSYLGKISLLKFRVWVKQSPSLGFLNNTGLIVLQKLTFSWGLMP